MMTFHFEVVAVIRTWPGFWLEVFSEVNFWGTFTHYHRKDMIRISKLVINRNLRRNLSSISTVNPWQLTDKFNHRHLGPRAEQVPHMLKSVGFDSMEVR